MNWPSKKLTEVCLPITKIGPAETGRERVQYVDIGVVDGVRHRIEGVGWVEAASAPSRCRQVVRSGDTVFSTVRPYLEKIAFIDDRLDGEFASTGFCVLRPNPELEPRFLFHYSTSRGLLDQVLPKQKGVSYPAVLDREVRACVLPVPPLPEQRRIVAILEEHLSDLDAAVESATHARGRAEALLHSHLLGLVLGDGKGSLAGLRPGVLGGASAPPIPLPDGWSWLKWSKVGTSQNGRAFSSSLYRSEGVRLLRPGNLGADGRLVWSPSSTKHLPIELAGDHAAFLLKPGDLVMNLTAQSLKDDFLGRVCLVGRSDGALLNQRIARLRAVRISEQYALMVFRSKLFRRYVESLNTGSLIQHMFTKQVNEFWLPTPPSSDHERRLVTAWESFAETVQRLSGVASTADVRAQALRRAILAAAFSGRLTGYGSDNDVIEELAEEESA